MTSHQTSGGATIRGGAVGVVRGGTTGPLRGSAVGALTAALAVAGHGLAGGGYPTTAALTLLVLCSTVAGAVAATCRGTRTALAAALAGGQLLGHLILSGTTVHQHAATASAATMLVAHTVATALCAALIVAAEKLYDPITRALRVPLRGPVARPLRRRSHRIPAATDPLTHLLLDHVVSRRGPPAAEFA
ncbi:hypothetical protein [Rhodococcus gannanensis]|uniref:Fusaric acid resistance protein-like n=1 Tax=Rhodococcus gannanensis TaxID=1960308 RepID=A0ABW4P199_9NOCA